MWNRGTPCFIALCFIEFHRCCVFYKLKARPSTSKKSMTHFIVILALLLWSVNCKLVNCTGQYFYFIAFCVNSVSIEIIVLSVLQMVALAVSPWISDDFYIFLKICSSVHIRLGLWSQMMKWSSDSQIMLFALKLIFSATTADTPAFFWLDFSCIFSICTLLKGDKICGFGCSLPHLFVVYQRADLQVLAKGKNRHPFNHEASSITIALMCGGRIPLYGNCVLKF